MTRHDKRFALVERNGHREDELIEADDLEGLVERAAEKAGFRLDAPEVER